MAVAGRGCDFSGSIVKFCRQEKRETFHEKTFQNTGTGVQSCFCGIYWSETKVDGSTINGLINGKNYLDMIFEKVNITL